jgi:hypothetical protein
LSTGRGLEEIIAASEVLLVDKDVWNGTLTGLLLEVLLNGGTVINLVQFDRVELGETLESFLSAAAVSYGIGTIVS